MKRLFQLFIMVTLVLSAYAPAVFAEEKNAEQSIQLADQAASAILMERDTGTILYEKNGDEKLPPASMTKVMTMLLIMEAIEKGELTLDEKIRTSEYAASMGGSQIFLEEGEEMTVNDLLKGIAIASANDASVALAERIAGSVDSFVQMMNDKSEALGLTNTNFKNPTGLPAGDHYSSAKDMAIMSKELLKYDLVTEYTKLYEDYLREDTDKKFWLVNTNRLVKFYDGVDGLKTGYTSEAKYCLTATAIKDNMRVIAVIMGAPTPKDRNRQITNMLDYAFNQYKSHPMYKRSDVLSQINISKGDQSKADVITTENISLLTKKGENIDNVEKEIVLHTPLKAPLKKGEKIGTIILKKDNEILVESPVTVAKDVKVASWWKLFNRTMGKFSQSVD